MAEHIPQEQTKGITGKPSKVRPPVPGIGWQEKVLLGGSRPEDLETTMSKKAPDVRGTFPKSGLQPRDFGFEFGNSHPEFVFAGHELPAKQMDFFPLWVQRKNRHPGCAQMTVFKYMRSSDSARILALAADPGLLGDLSDLHGSTSFQSSD